MNGSRVLASAGPMTVGRYLLLRLKEIGVDHVFGVAGDFVLGFLNQVLKSDVTLITTCNELNAAYAADGYARIHGVGVFTSTYTVGELSGINGVAGAFAERIPVVVITGSPSTESFRTRPLLHHTLGDYTIPRQMYEKMFDFITALTRHLQQREPASLEMVAASSSCTHRRSEPFVPGAGTALTVSRLFDRLCHYFADDSIILADTGISLFSAAETLMPEGGQLS